VNTISNDVKKNSNNNTVKRSERPFNFDTYKENTSSKVFSF
jgi:hypothetical protein